MSKKQPISTSNQPTNVSTTGKTTKCIYKINGQPINPSKVSKLKANNFELFINGVKVEINDSIKNIHVTASGVSFNK